MLLLDVFDTGVFPDKSKPHPGTQDRVLNPRDIEKFRSKYFLAHKALLLILDPRDLLGHLLSCLNVILRCDGDLLHDRGTAPMDGS